MSKPTPPALRALLRSLVVCTISAGSSLAQAPVVPGLHVNDGVSPLEHGLPGNRDVSPLEVGRVLLQELRCGACHMDLPASAMPEAPGPDLAQVGARVRPEYLRHFLANPRTVQPGTKMPDMLAGNSGQKRVVIADALTHFLVQRAQSAASPPASSESSPERGASLYHRVGCVVCHGARRSAFVDGRTPDTFAGHVGLTHVPGKYSSQNLANFLYEPLEARPGGRMPDMGLSRAEAADLASYLTGNASAFRAGWQLDEAKAREGEELFKSLGCAACHPMEGIDPPSKTPLGSLDSDKGCLAQDAQTAPDFGLDASQQSALRAALEDRRELTTQEQIDQTLLGLNCTACHERDGLGGPAQAHKDFFGSDEPNLGEHAFMPPRLNLAGAKLRPAWMRKVLFDGATARPYMHTRMPQFGAANLQQLPGQFAAVDKLPDYEMPLYKGDASNAAKEGGRELLGIKGLACISCHNFNGKLSPNMHGMDLIDTCDRLQPAWFAGFLQDPQRYRPGIIMPESWSGGEAAHQGILDGDTDAQIRAIWFFLGQGRTARNPDGLMPSPSLLEVGERPRLYRGRSGIAGFRGIAVGFPGGLNYAFDARTGAFCGVWRGNFVNVRWDGQGAGDFNPASRAIRLARDLALHAFDPAQQAWPLRPRVSKEEPVNADPDYPRNLGYQFGGYSLDPGGVPTLEYAIGQVQVLDRTSSKEGQLTRVLSIHSPVAQSLWFRALAGEVQVHDDQSFQLGKLRLRTPKLEHLLRPTDSPEGPSELLLELPLPAGDSTWSFDYDITQ